jgi:hypothetical protein
LTTGVPRHRDLGSNASTDIDLSQRFEGVAVLRVQPQGFGDEVEITWLRGSEMMHGKERLTPRDTRVFAHRA